MTDNLTWDHFNTLCCVLHVCLPLLLWQPPLIVLVFMFLMFLYFSCFSLVLTVCVCVLIPLITWPSGFKHIVLPLSMSDRFFRRPASVFSPWVVSVRKLSPLLCVFLGEVSLWTSSVFSFSTFSLLTGLLLVLSSLRSFRRTVSGILATHGDTLRSVFPLSSLYTLWFLPHISCLVMQLCCNDEHIHTL